jgi:hypothetical protein
MELDSLDAEIQVIRTGKDTDAGAARSASESASVKGGSYEELKKSRDLPKAQRLVTAMKKTIEALKKRADAKGSFRCHC